MTDERATKLSEALARGRKAADQLGSATDQLTETIAKIERALEELRFGVPASIEILREDQDAVDQDGEHMSFTSYTELAFRKEGKHWVLLIESAIEPSGPDQWTATPLLNASRSLRLLAIKKLPELIDKLVAASEKSLAEINEGQRQADAVLAALTEQTMKKSTPRFAVPKVADAAIASAAKERKP